MELPELQQSCLRWIDDLLQSGQIQSLPPSPFAGLPSSLQEHLASCLCDVIWLFDLQYYDETSPASSSNERRQSLATLLMTLHHAGLIPLSLAKERLEPELLEQAGLLQSASLFTRRLVRANTHQLYRQQKYNLWREEPEGYAQLLVQLVENASAADLPTRITRLIGISMRPFNVHRLL